MADLPFDRECFFIAPIGEEESPVRVRSDAVLKHIVAKAAEQLDLTAVRADQLAEPGQINIHVIEHLISAKAAVADLTGSNANVFYELAVRHTAKLPTVLIAEEGEDLPFDIAQMRTIWFDHKDLESADQARLGIVAQLQRALEGAVDSPIATTVDLQSLASGSSAVERTVLELAESVGGLSRNLLALRDRLDSLADRAADGRADFPSINPLAIRQLQHSLEFLSDLARDMKYQSRNVDPDDPLNEMIVRAQEEINSLREIADYLDSELGAGGGFSPIRPLRSSRMEEDVGSASLRPPATSRVGGKAKQEK